METQILFIFAIVCFAIDVVSDAFPSDSWAYRANWTAAGLCLFAIAIMLA